ncbi:secretin and TonB N-terminal domain-containing protein [Methylotenera sp.]|uniref:secretin and TonB N-terminal domain-containing protein n=1 Tax=Methylotenera sp. TaxID=2051956 RepID=UPI0024876EDA|nr:secretin and TonB N-terminal domain-containing protein [Methylotenera sp.]MDI1361637.1 secretin and TonB N-terminal domain-containing protein [Methylotenera sp.]
MNLYRLNKSIMQGLVSGHFIVLLACLILLTSCASLNATQEPAGSNMQAQDSAAYEEANQLILKGDTATGIAKLQQLVKSYPENAQYRTNLKIQQSSQINTLLKTADDKSRLNLLSDSEFAYQQVLVLAPDNQRAQDGLRQISLLQNHAMMLTNAKSAFDKNDDDTALNILRSILAEDANDQGARNLFEQIESKQNKKITAIPQIKTAYKKPITLELKNVPIKTVFELIGKTANINFIYDQELRTDLNTSIFVRNSSIEDAIKVILTSNQLGKKVLNDNTLLIYPLSRSQEYQEQYVRSFYLNSMDAKRAMNMIKTVVKSKDIYIDEKLNTLIMRDTAEAIQIAEKLIASQDMLEPEVMLEVEVMEINRKNLEAIGIKYPTQMSVGVQGKSTATDGVVTATPGRLTIAELKSFNSGLGVFSVSDPVLALNLLQQNTDTNLLANPQIRVKNREKAKIHVGDKIPVLTSIANSTGFVSQTVSYIDVGIKLDVEPTILLQNRVSIKVGLEVSNVTDQVKTDSGVLAYTIGSRNANTVLQLKDGETQILAGLFRDDSQNISNKVPGLSSLPFIGRLFSDKNNDRRKNEIVLLITPRILHNIAPANAVYTLFPSGVNHASGRSTKALEQQSAVAEPVQAQVATPQNTQTERAQVDQDFANQLLQPDVDANANGNVGKTTETNSGGTVYKAQ